MLQNVGHSFHIPKQSAIFLIKNVTELNTFGEEFAKCLTSFQPLDSHISALQLNGNVSDQLVDLGHFLGQESNDFSGLIQGKNTKSWAFWPMALPFK